MAPWLVKPEATARTAGTLKAVVPSRRTVAPAALAKAPLSVLDWATVSVPRLVRAALTVLPDSDSVPAFVSVPAPLNETLVSDSDAPLTVRSALIVEAPEIASDPPDTRSVSA